MPIPSNKKELIEAITANFEKLRSELNTTKPADAVTQDLEGHLKGTKMSVKDLMAYLLGWGLLVLKWNKKMDRGEKADFPETGYKWNELGLLAQKFYSDHKKETYISVLKKLEKNVEEILVLVNKKSAKDLYGVTWGEKYTLGRMIQLNTASPYKNAFLRLRKWKKTRAK